MRHLRYALALAVVTALAGCGNWSISGSTLNPPSGNSQVNISIQDMAPMGATILSFQATVTGITLQPGNVNLMATQTRMEMTQLQTMAAYMGTMSVPVGVYTGMTITLANPRITYMNTSGGMMMGGSCAIGQICQMTPTMMASSVTITGAPFPLVVQDNMPLDMVMDFDVMDSMQSNMSVNPTMSSMMREPMTGSGAFGEMNDMIGQIQSVSGSNQFTMQFAQGMPSMTITTDSSTVFEDFDSIGKSNDFSGLAAGLIVEVDLQVMAAGVLRATRVKLESATGQELDGMVVAINNATQFDMVVMNEALSVPGISIGDMARVNMQAGTMFDVDDQSLPMSGMTFAGSADMAVGQMVRVEPMAAAVPGTPSQVTTNRVRLLCTFFTATLASKINATDFMVNGLPGLMTSAGMSGMRISTSTQTQFEGVTGMGGLNAGDTVSLRGPMFMQGGSPVMIAGIVRKR